jgi:hypothetical protein
MKMYETMYNVEFKYLSSWHHLQHQPMMSKTYGQSKKTHVDVLATPNPALKFSNLQTTKVAPSSTTVLPVSSLRDSKADANTALQTPPLMTSSQNKFQQKAAPVQQSQPVVEEQCQPDTVEYTDDDYAIVEEGHTDFPIRTSLGEWDQSMEEFYDDFGVDDGVDDQVTTATPETVMVSDDDEALPSASTIHTKSQTMDNSRVDASFSTSTAFSLATTAPQRSVDDLDHSRHIELENTVGAPGNLVGTKRAKRMNKFEEQQVKTMADVKKLQTFQQDSISQMFEFAQKTVDTTISQALQQFSSNFGRKVTRQIRRLVAPLTLNGKAAKMMIMNNDEGNESHVVDDGHDLNDEDQTVGHQDNGDNEEIAHYPGIGFVNEDYLDGVFKAARAIYGKFT